MPSSTWLPRRVQVAGRSLPAVIEELQSAIASAFEALQKRLENKSPCLTVNSAEVTVPRGATVVIPRGVSCTIIAPYPFDGDDLFVFRQGTSGTVYIKTRSGQGTIVGSGTSYTLPGTVGTQHFRAIDKQWTRVI